MAEKTIDTRIVYKHAVEADWRKAVNFIPKNAELIIYDADATHNYKRIKIGDGVTKVNSLKFVDSAVNDLIDQLTNNLESMRETTYEKINTLRDQIIKNDIFISENKPSYACTWFRATAIQSDDGSESDYPIAVLDETAFLDQCVLA